MALYTYKVTNVCSGGNHYTLEVTGDHTMTIPLERESLRQINISHEDLALMLLKLYSQDKTNTQIRTALQNGISVSVSLVI